MAFCAEEKHGTETQTINLANYSKWQKNPLTSQSDSFADVAIVYLERVNIWAQIEWILGCESTCSSGARGLPVEAILHVLKDTRVNKMEIPGFTWGDPLWVSQQVQIVIFSTAEAGAPPPLPTLVSCGKHGAWGISHWPPWQQIQPMSSTAEAIQVH